MAESQTPITWFQLTDRNELEQAITEFNREHEAKAGRVYKPLPRPAELDQPGIDPALRAQILDAYVSAILEIPHGLWDAGMRKAVQESVLQSLRAAQL